MSVDIAFSSDALTVINQTSCQLKLLSDSWNALGTSEYTIEKEVTISRRIHTVIFFTLWNRTSALKTKKSQPPWPVPWFWMLYSHICFKVLKANKVYFERKFLKFFRFFSFYTVCYIYFGPINLNILFDSFEMRRLILVLKWVQNNWYVLFLRMVMVRDAYTCIHGYTTYILNL